MSRKERIILNISGDKYETLEKTLKRFPDTLLGNFNKRQKHISVCANEYFFNRNRNAFEAILFFYQSNGRLSRPPTVNMDIFEEECHFFEIPVSYIQDMKSKEGLTLPDDEEDDLRIYPLSCQQKIWYFLEIPDTAISKAFTILSLTMVAISIIATCLETMNALKVDDTKYGNPWFVIELSLNSWFLSELALKLIVSPSKLQFFKSSLNWIDLVTVVPYFIAFALDRGQGSSIGFLKIFRLLRVIRLFRLSQHLQQIKIIGKIIKDSLADFQLFLLCLLIIVIFGGSLIYFMENTTPNTQFTSIPEGIWCALQTIVTLGYGDIVPETVIGKLFMSLFMVFGALTLSLPVLSIVMKFTTQYSLNNIS